MKTSKLKGREKWLRKVNSWKPKYRDSCVKLIRPLGTKKNAKSSTKKSCRYLFMPAMFDRIVAVRHSTSIKRRGFEFDAQIYALLLFKIYKLCGVLLAIINDLSNNYQLKFYIIPVQFRYLMSLINLDFGHFFNKVLTFNELN